MITLFILPLLLGAAHPKPHAPLPKPGDIPVVELPEKGTRFSLGKDDLKKAAEPPKVESPKVEKLPKLGPIKECKDVKPPVDTVPGWRIERYDRGAHVGGLMPARSLGVGNAPALPLQLSTPTSEPSSSALRGTLVRGQFVVCDEGLYTFGFYVEVPKGDMLCTMFVDIGSTRLFAAENFNLRTDEGIKQFLGKDLRLEPGVQEVKIWLDCAERQFAGFSSATVTYNGITSGWLATTFALKVRGPDDDGLRNFKRGEVWRPK